MDALLDEAPCGFLVFNDQGIVTLANRTLLLWLGYTAEELAGQKFEALLGVAGRIFYHTHFFPLLTLQGHAQEIFLSFRTKEKASLPVLLNARQQLSEEGVTENHCVLMPVHQRQKYEEELLQARRTAEEAMEKNERLQTATSELEQSKMALDQQVTRLSLRNEDLTNFSRVISHDMQEPVRKIVLFADMALRESNENYTPKIQYAVERITAASHRMRRLTACLEQYVGIDINDDAPGLCNLNALVGLAWVKAANAFPGALIHIEMEEIPVITGNCIQLEEMFYQLIANAVRFKKAGAGSTEIRIEADVIQQNSYRTLQDKYRYVDFVRIAFSDNGKGFPAEYSDYIFGLFKKVNEDNGGMGFGLALCKKIVSNHFGFLSAQSDTDEGATFTILLPIGPVE